MPHTPQGSSEVRTERSPEGGTPASSARPGRRPGTADPESLRRAVRYARSRLEEALLGIAVHSVATGEPIALPASDHVEADNHLDGRSGRLLEAALRLEGRVAASDLGALGDHWVVQLPGDRFLVVVDMGGSHRGLLLCDATERSVSWVLGNVAPRVALICRGVE